MKKAVLLFSMFLLVSFGSFYAQTLNDYVSQVKGDTLVIKDFIEAGNQPSSIINAVELDTQAPAGRVYMLKKGGYYPLSRSFDTPDSRTITIVGQDRTRLAVSKSVDMPPIVCGYSQEGTTNNGNINFKNDLTVKNAIVMPAVDNGSLGWAFFGASAVGKKLTLENVLMEHTRWVFIQSNDWADTKIFLSDCYFVNASGQPCRRNGGVYDNVGTNTDVINVENCTHVMFQGMSYKFRNFAVNNAFFNHNTFVNCSGQLFPTFGYQSNWVVTNNLFVNSNVQGYSPGLDVGETDQDNLPMGIINVAPLPAGMTTPKADRKILVDANGVYWDPKLDVIVTNLNNNSINGVKTWVTQMITMNTRTKTLFDNNTEYPKLTEGAWIKGGDPAFVKPLNLLTDGVTDLIAWSSVCADDNNTAVMPDWRTASNPAKDNYIYPDWPLPADLSYTNTAYLTAGYAGMPLGDLNWFPAKKATWSAQKATEHAAIQAALNNGTVLVGGGSAAVNTNGSFEASNVGVATAISGFAIAVGASVSPAPVYEIVGTGAQDGSKALKIAIGGVGTNAWDIELTGDKIPVEPGAIYNYSVWLKSVPTGGVADVTVGNKAYNEYGSIRPANLTDQWQEFKFEFKITDQETEIRAPLHFSKAANANKAIYVDNLKITKKSVVGVQDLNEIPKEYSLDQNYPNPFNPTTVINFSILKPGFVTLKVYNTLGQEVATLVNEYKNASSYQVNFNASNLSSGVYVYTLTVGNQSFSKKMMLMK